MPITNNTQEVIYRYRGLPLHQSEYKGCRYKLFGSYHFKDKESLQEFIDKNVHKRRLLPGFQAAGNLSVNITPWQDAVKAVEQLETPSAVMNFVKGEHRESVKAAARETVKALSAEGESNE